MWDTPGLEGGDNDEAYLQEIKEKCANFDLFLYCIKMTEARATDLFDAKSSLKKFTQLFGRKRLWKNAVVVLTHGNTYFEYLKEIKTEKSEDVAVEFLRNISMWKKKVRKNIKKLGYRKAKKVPVMPAGIAKQPSLPGYPYWLSMIFDKVMDRINEDAAYAYLQLSKDRLQPVNDIDEDSVSKKKNSRPTICGNS